MNEMEWTERVDKITSSSLQQTVLELRGLMASANTRMADIAPLAMQLMDRMTRLEEQVNGLLRVCERIDGEQRHAVPAARSEILSLVPSIELRG